jgi:hypothetical protein
LIGPFMEISRGIMMKEEEEEENGDGIKKCKNRE